MGQQAAQVVCVKTKADTFSQYYEILVNIFNLKPGLCDMWMVCDLPYCAYLWIFCMFLDILGFYCVPVYLMMESMKGDFYLDYTCVI